MPTARTHQIIIETWPMREHRPGDATESLFIEAVMTTSEFSPAQHAEARRIADLAYAASYDDFLHMARVLVSRPDDRPLERGDLKVRECVYRFGARVVEAAFRVWKERPRQPGVLTHPLRDDRIPSAWDGFTPRELTQPTSDALDSIAFSDVPASRSRRIISAYLYEQIQ
jgi:hypothetical protein